jgi:hypothetical protein
VAEVLVCSSEKAVVIIDLTFFWQSQSAQQFVKSFCRTSVTGTFFRPVKATRSASALRAALTGRRAGWVTAMRVMG